MSLAAIVMAAGRGTRMGSSTPKPLLELAGRPMVEWVIAAARGLDPAPLVVVASPETRYAYAGVDVAVQQEPGGTAGAVAAARPILAGFGGDLLVLAADTPLVTTATLAALVAEHRRSSAGVTLLSLESDEPLAYGRVIRDGAGALKAVVEERDASDAELEVRELNASVYVFRASALWRSLERLDTNNAKLELQLTSAVCQIVASGLPGSVVAAADPVEAHGVNTPGDLAAAEAVLRQRPPLQN
jgi:bifunctional UDP-N-acetylglucosamine pyrophosphorylase/glucosamine-1-phosphate N-acetyltransferase